MGKNSPALFELIRDPGVNQKSMPVARQTRHAGSTPLPASGDAPLPPPEEAAPLPVIPRVEPKPRITLAVSRQEPTPTPAPAPEPEPAPAPTPTITFPRVIPLSRLPLNPSTISIAAGVLILGLILVWATAFRMGESRAERAARQKLELAGVSDPLKADAVPLNPGLLSPEPGSQAAPPARSPQPPARVANPRPAPPQPVGPLADTRQTGLNYCIAASMLSKEAADRAAAFLRENGVPAVAVLDGGSPASNNAGSWKVVALQGITAQEYKDRAPVRLKVEAELTRLGEVYRKDPKGRVDFGQFGWEKKKD